jgi:menaquinol-cytochrome c reductase iron-sulfur subunit
VAYVDPEPLPWAGFAARSTAWVRRDGPDAFVAFSPYCTHVGCPVTWAAGAELFMCPCHGGTFHRDGSVAAGPPPRPLDRLAVRVRDGQVEVYTRGLPVAE